MNRTAAAERTIFRVDMIEFLINGLGSVFNYYITIIQVKYG
jgi:hypothetical protein